MIRIQKPVTPPARLARQGKKKRELHCTDYSSDPTAYQSGHKTFTFDRSVYAHSAVKQALMKAQYKKCCFCERVIGSDGDVEHFRPKQAYKQADGTPLQRPGYYWLAYKWNNLYLACTGCNQRHKQNLFPLQDPGKRTVSHDGNIDDEAPIFIDPGKEEPEEYIGFRGEFAYALNGNVRGEETIKALGLNADERGLPEARLQRLQMLKAFWNIVKIAQSDEMLVDVEFQKVAKEAEAKLKEAQQVKSEFSAMARWACKENFQTDDE